MLAIFLGSSKGSLYMRVHFPYEFISVFVHACAFSLGVHKDVFTRVYMFPRNS